jgi:hypothetical protein
MHLLREEESKVKASREKKRPKLSLSRFVSADGGEGDVGMVFSPWYVEKDLSCTSLYFFLTLKILKLQSDSYWGRRVGNNWFENYTRSFYDAMLPSPEPEFVNV